MAKVKVNWSEDLTDDVFNVHEEIFDEKSLFQLHTLCDKIMQDNPNAKQDGGFKIKLSKSIQGTGSSLQEFWARFGCAPQFLVSLFLSCEQGSAGIMKLHSRRVSAADGHEFKKAVKDPLTFDTSRSNCCMQALKEGGPKAAVVHFYDCLAAKATTNKTTKTVHKPSTNHYRDRQLLLVENDPSLTCVQIEKSMKDRKYTVQKSNALTTSADDLSNDRSSSIFDAFVPSNLNQDGDGDNCSLYFNGIEETCDKFLYITPNFALAHLCHLNMLTDLPEYFSGISYPFVYLGGLHSVFPIHIEDMSLWSVNYNHLGHPKLIIIIRPSEISRLSLLLTTYGLSWSSKDCIQQLFHKSDIVFPQWLLEHGFKFKVFIQYPGEFIVFAPNAAHTGGNMGPNLAEACNFGSKDWLPFGSVASLGRCDCIENGVQFDVTQLIRVHRKELLPYHKDMSMWINFKDEHFQRSLIIPPTLCYSSTPVAASSLNPTSGSQAQRQVKSEQHIVTCPVKACGKKFKGGLKRTIAKHISQRHPDCVNDVAVKQYLSA